MIYIEYTEEFEHWRNKLSRAEKISAATATELLKERGTNLPYPYPLELKAPNTSICAN